MLYNLFWLISFVLFKSFCFKNREALLSHTKWWKPVVLIWWSFLFCNLNLSVVHHKSLSCFSINLIKGSYSLPLKCELYSLFEIFCTFHLIKPFHVVSCNICFSNTSLYVLFLYPSNTLVVQHRKLCYTIKHGNASL